MIDHFFGTICSTSISPGKLWKQCETSYIWSRKIHGVCGDLYEKWNMFINSLYNLFFVACMCFTWNVIYTFSIQTYDFLVSFVDGCYLKK